MKKLHFILICLALFVTSIAYADDKEYAQLVRESIWNSDDPEFNNYTIPSEYDNESAVIIAKREEILSTGKTKIRFTGGGILGFGTNKELYYTFLTRTLVKINDKSALEEFGDIEFIEKAKSGGRNVSTEMKTIIGVRIIKPDGTIQEVDIDEAISVTEGKKEKESHKKLAISDLQIGDIIDYFTQLEGRVDYTNIPRQRFFFSSKYPMLSYAVHCEIGNKLTTEYRSLNGAPDFEVSTDEDKNVILDVKETNIPKLDDTRWVSPYRQIPMIRLAILFNNNKDIYKPASYRKSGVYKDLSSETILNDAMGWFAASYYYIDVYRDVKKDTKKYVKEHPEADKKQIAQHIDENMREQISKYKNLYSQSYIHTLYLLLKDFKIENKIGFVPSRFGSRPEDVTDANDFEIIIVANDGEQIFTSPESRMMLGTTLPENEGETAYMVSVKKLDPKKKEGIVGVRSQMELPVSNASQNTRDILLNINLDENNLLDVDRTVSLSGHTRNGSYSNLIHWSEWRDAKREWLGLPTQMEIYEKKNDQKNIKELKANIERTNEEIEDKAKEEIKSYHDMEPKEMTEHKMLSLGSTPDNNVMVYNVKYLMDGLVKRAGNNLILDAGKLIGKQLTLDDYERDRIVDIYRLYPMTHTYEINIQIPSGYRAENIDKMNMRLDNECASFISSASVNGSQLTLKVSRIFKNNFDSVNNWKMTTDIIDKANEFYAQSIVLKKI